MQNRAVYREGHVEAGIGKMVETLGFVLAAGAARVLAKHLDKPGQLCGRDVFLQRLREVDLELLPGVLLDEAADGVGMPFATRRAPPSIRMSAFECWTALLFGNRTSVATSVAPVVRLNPTYGPEKSSQLTASELLATVSVPPTELLTVLSTVSLRSRSGAETSRSVTAFAPRAVSASFP